MSNPDGIENYEEFNQGLLQNMLYPWEFKLWKLLATLVIPFFVMMLMSFIVCMSDTKCRTSIPTINTLLSSPVSSTFINLALFLGLCIFFVTSMTIWKKTNRYSVAVTSELVLLSVGVILFVFPFTGWKEDGAIIGFIVTFLIWMIYVVLAMKSAKKKLMFKITLSCTIMFIVTSIIYITLSSITTVVPHKDVGVLVVEIVGGISIFVFMAACILFVAKTQVVIEFLE